RFALVARIAEMGARQVGTFGAQIAQRHARGSADMVDAGRALRAPYRFETHAVGLPERVDGELVIKRNVFAPAGAIAPGAAIIGAQCAHAGLMIVPQIGAVGGVPPRPIAEIDAARLRCADARNDDLPRCVEMRAGRPASRNRKTPAVARAKCGTGAVDPHEAI